VEVILLSDVEKLGLRGEVVNVARGYARNYLLPRRLAQAATPARVAELRKVEEHRSRHEAQTAEQARELAAKLSEVELRFDVKAGPTGSLFGSVTPTDIADALWKEHKVRVDRRKLGTENIKRIGRYDVPVELFTDVQVDVRTLVVPEGGELPPEEELQAMEAAERAAEEAEAAGPETEGPVLEEILEAEEAAEAEEAGAADEASEPEEAAAAEEAGAPAQVPPEPRQP
jgi:large subunit ribosomal protein L9